jgi:hypothetical protein
MLCICCFSFLGRMVCMTSVYKSHASFWFRMYLESVYACIYICGVCFFCKAAHGKLPRHMLAPRCLLAKRQLFSSCLKDVL